MRGPLTSLAKFANRVSGGRLSDSRLVRRTYRRTLNLKRVYDVGEFRMALDLTDRAQARILFDSDPFDALYLRDLVDDETVFWDVGANVGYTALTAASAGARGVVAFEADPDTYARLVHNCELNGFGDVVTVQVAVAAAPGQAEFHRSTDVSSGINSLASDDRLGETVTVPTDTVDALAAEYDRPDLVKVDVEGAEQKVLEGAGETLETVGPDWLIEVHSSVTGDRRDRLAQHGGSAEAIHDLLTDHGYTVYGVSRTDGGPVYDELSSVSETPLHWYATQSDVV